jgi:hypothetical protein
MSEPVDVLKNVTATVNGRDVVQLASRIIVAEDINSSFVRSSIEVARDSRYEMQEALAGNQVQINIQPQNGPSLTASHVVHSAKPSLHKTAKGLTGSIVCIDEDYGKCFISKRVTKAWDKTNTDKAIKEIHEEVGSKKKLEISPGFKQASFTSPSLMPMKAIEKAGGLSGAQSKGFYYQTHKDGGSAYFKTMDDLSKQGPKKQFVYKGAGSADMGSLGDASTIFDIHYEGSSVSTQKQTEAQGQRFNPQFGKFANNDAASRGLSTPGLGVDSKQAAKVGFPVVNSPEQDKEKRHIDRDQQNLNKYTAKLQLLVPIATDIHAGDVIEVKSGSATYFSDANPDNAASGKWLVVSLMHSVEIGGRGETPGHTGRTILHCVGKIS